VEQRLADRLWPGVSPIGRRVRLLSNRAPAIPADVIGVVDHVQAGDPRQQGLPQIYEPPGLRGYFPAFVIRTDGDPRAIAGPVKAAIAEPDGAIEGAIGAAGAAAGAAIAAPPKPADNDARG